MCSSPRAAAPGRSDGRWLRTDVDHHPEAPHVVCLPHAGGGASFYRGWAAHVPAGVGFGVVEYPGREERLGEAVPTEIGVVARSIARDVLRATKGPLVLLGHSMGTAIAFEVARLVERERPGALRRLVVSARPAPHEAVARSVRDHDDDALVAHLAALGGTDPELLADPELRALVLPAVRGDYELLAGYRADPAARIDAPIVALTGDADPTVPAGAMAGWATLTRGGFRVRELSGDHFYVVAHAAEVVAEAVRGLDATTGPGAAERTSVASDPGGAPVASAGAVPADLGGPPSTAPGASRGADAELPPDADDDRIAIVGYSGRFPGAPDPDALWRVLRDGVEATREASDEALLAAGAAPSLLEDPRLVRRYGALDDVDRFDAAFFGMSPREAELLDPQHRLVLECAWEAFEHAGHDPASDDDAVGVFAGCGASTYLLAQVLPSRGTLRSVGEMAALMGSEKDFLASRLSYKLDLRGPSATVLSGCSTGLVAVHLGVQSLLGGESDVALAAAGTIFFPRDSAHLSEEGSIRSPRGRCRAFDAEADGTVAGEAVACVVLKRLADAERDGDVVHGVLRGTAVNNDGAAKAGFTAPSAAGQTAVVDEALAVSGLEPSDIDYVEAHGTGTPLGDPIEIEALTAAFGPLPAGSVGIGTSKPNVGHTDTAAGLVGLIKVLLALRHEELPPSINCDTPSPAIDFPKTPFRVVRERTPWTRNGRPRRAGVSAFSVGGTNAHVVVEEAPRRPVRAAVGAPAVGTDTGRAPAAGAPGSSDRDEVVLLSARTPAALDVLTDATAARLAAPGAPAVADVAFTTQRGRARFARRRTLVVPAGAGPADAAALLRDRDPATVRDGAADGVPDVVLLLPGQGSQRVGMARALAAEDPAVAARIAASCAALRPALGLDLRQLLWPAAGDEDDAALRLARTELTQPALFVVEHAVAERLLTLGLTPRGLLGHSIGELVAATLAGVLAVDDALALVARRGALIDACPPGAMVAVSLDETAARAVAGDALSVAALNGPRQTVLSGAVEDVDRLVARLAEDGTEHRRLRTSHAFHSPLVDGAADAFAAEVARVALRPPTIPVVSNVTGTWLTATQATDPAYWGRQLRATVRFADGVRTLLQAGPALAVEAGPGESLRHALTAWGTDAPAVVPTLGRDGTATVAGIAGALWRSGIELDWDALHEGRDPRRTVLPTYPFERARHWAAPTPADRAEGIAPFSPIPLDHAATGGAGADAATPEDPGPSNAEETAGREPAGGGEVGHGTPAPTDVATSTTPGPAPEIDDRPAVSTAFVAPRTEVEEQVAAIWRAQLGITRLGVHDDLLELGGHSLLATRIATQVQERFPIELAAARVLTDARTVAELASLVERLLAEAVEAMSADEIDRLLAEEDAR